MILGRGEAGRRFFCNNEVKKGPSPCVDDLRGGASLLPAPCPDRRDLPLRLEDTQQAGERDEEEKVLAAPLPPLLHLLLLPHVPFLTLQPNIITWHQRYWPISQSLTPEPRCGYGNLELFYYCIAEKFIINIPIRAEFNINILYFSGVLPYVMYYSGGFMTNAFDWNNFSVNFVSEFSVSGHSHLPRWYGKCGGGVFRGQTAKPLIPILEFCVALWDNDH